MTSEPDTTRSKNPSPLKLRMKSIVIPILLPLLVLLGGGILASSLMESGPKAKRETPARQARLVEVEKIHFSKQHLVIEAMGTVRPAREIDLKPRVAGEIIWVSKELIPGGRFERGQKILQIDSSDYELLVQQRNADFAQAQSKLRLELGQQSIAESEFEMLGESISEGDRDLVLRTPQLESVRAEIEKARSVLQKAKLDLERTRISAPFNAIVKTRGVNLGDIVSISTSLATLVGTDEYWIEVLVPVDQLRWIQIPSLNGKGSGSRVKIHNESGWGRDGYKIGNVIRLASDLEEEGRMARIIVSVPDPFHHRSTSIDGAHLLIGSYVRVEIEGTDLEKAAAIDRTLLRDGDYVWIMGSESTLKIRPVKVAFRGRGQVYVTEGIHEGERLITTDLAAPLEGMPLRIQSEEIPGKSSPQPLKNHIKPKEKP